uniref:Uncharacterized protein n=1 Tax=Grammatophora oceanica TaxID=210454 RepID=A0A7S1YFA5_9STRA|mmetsp:Transcript_44055/g.65339  ORF Transcript_44055/g.65339 Transcript_44055/m.65339 type:complete len:307 (+) Transcript_44055:215-1135(+)|eukprot:CAMPEP_0194030344 /NCGR_PEP_ID=MMETSP0009_2-20130614/3871_1 /TAXON_ID=210454 /ORGANISM="Grammatophora oceanica, Strain CCMP 410" /LENGTH=306 /DNA_ID=CAMNT_0038670279 /DNA_START=213 /DNA_END=1133 /DNA_ORIENTATION=-
MCLPNAEESELLLLNIKVAKAKEELEKTIAKRREQRLVHETRMEMLFHRKVTVESRIAFQKKNSRLVHYLNALKGLAGANGSPYLLRKHAFLCQALHQNEVEVKQLQLAKRQHHDLSKWMSSQADALFTERTEIDRKLLLALHMLAAEMKGKQTVYKQEISDQRGDITKISGDESCNTEPTYQLHGQPWEGSDISVISSGSSSSKSSEGVSSIIDQVGGIAKGLFSKKSAPAPDATGSSSLGMTMLRAQKSSPSASPAGTKKPTTGSASALAGISLVNLVYQGLQGPDVEAPRRGDAVRHREAIAA